MILLAKKKFSIESQKKFSNFSGDYNPIHLCDRYSRKTIYGQILVHGMHAVLWALDSLTKKKKFFRNLDIRFIKPIFLNEVIACYWDEKKDIIHIKNSNTTLCKIFVTKVEKIVNFKSSVLSGKARLKPAKKTITEVEKLRSKKKYILFKGNIGKSNKIFENLKSVYGLNFVSEVCTLSYIVGMEVPGLNSLFVSSKISLKSNKKKIFYRINNVEQRLGMVSFEYFGNRIESQIETIFRQKPVKNPTIKKLNRYTKGKEFNFMNALVIGGSRGIGEMVSKLIVAGGGKVCFTYFKGVDDAKRILKESKSLSKGNSILEFNILNQKHIEKLKNKKNFNCIFYFATPKIFKSWNKNHDNQIFSNYKLFFFDQFKKIVKVFSEKKQKTIFFYPSTVFINENTLGYQSYIKSKILGENFCREYKDKNIIFYYPRLPKLITDQSQSFFESDPSTNIPILLEYLRKINLN